MSSSVTAGSGVGVGSGSDSAVGVESDGAGVGSVESPPQAASVTRATSAKKSVRVVRAYCMFGTPKDELEDTIY